MSHTPSNCIKQQIRSNIGPVICKSFLQWWQMSLNGIQSHFLSVQFDKRDQRFGCLYCRNKCVRLKLVVLNIQSRKLRSTQLGIIVQIPWVPGRINYYDTSCLGECKSKSTDLCGQQKNWSTRTLLKVLKDASKSKQQRRYVQTL